MQRSGPGAAGAAGELSRALASRATSQPTVTGTETDAETKARPRRERKRGTRRAEQRRTAREPTADRDGGADEADDGVDVGAAHVPCCADLRAHHVLESPRTNVVPEPQHHAKPSRISSLGEHVAGAAGVLRLPLGELSDAMVCAFPSHCVPRQNGVALRHSHVTPPRIPFSGSEMP